MKNEKFLDSVNAATEGFIYVMKTERNMRIHFLAGILTVIIGIYLNLEKYDLLFLCVAISLVLISEMFNTAIEHTIDLVREEYHPLAKIVKDVSAGCVFISAVNAVIAAYMVFAKNLSVKLEEGIYKIRQSEWHVTFIALVIVLSFVVLGKTISKKGTPFRGGMPSGHAAFAFAIWVILTMVTGKGLVAVLTFIMAVLIARHRTISKIHTAWEVLVGALLGTLCTTIVFQMLK